MCTRITSAIIGIILLGLIIDFGGWIFCVSIAILNIYAIYELSIAFKKINIHINFSLCTIITIVILLFSSLFYDLDFIIIYFPVIVMLILAFLYNIINSNRTKLIDTVFSIFTFIYTSLLFISILLVRNFPQGLNLTWWIFIVIWGSDTGAYFAGMFFGRKLLAPNISPRKTLEGSLGGVLSSIILSMIFARLLLSEIILTKHAIALGCLIGLVSQIGDLSASLIKRYCVIKDFSNIIPGHGGILDRLDSALFSFPTAYIYIKILFQKGGIL